MGGSVPHAIKEQAEKGKLGLVSLLIESQGLPTDDLLGFMWNRFPQSECLVTTEQWFRTANQPGSIPYGCVVGVDGTMLFEGRPTSDTKKFAEAIDGELKKIKTGWGKSAEIKKARMLLYSKDAIAEAAAILAAAEATVKDDAKDDFAAAKAEVDVQYANRKSAIDLLLKQGRAVDAQEAAKAFAKAVKGKAEWEAEAKAMVEQFADATVAGELKADQQIEKILKAAKDKGPTPEHAKALKAIADKNQGLKAAARASELAKAAEFKAK